MKSIIEKSIDKIVKGGIWLILGMVISRCFNYLYKIIIARIGVQEFGIFSISMAVVETLSVIAALGLPMAVFYFIPHYQANDKKNELASTIIISMKIMAIVSFIFSIFLFIFADIIAIRLFHNGKIGIILKFLAFFIPIRNIRDLLTKILIGFQRVKFRVYIRNIIEDGARFFSSFFFIVAGFGLMAAIYGYIIGILLSLISAFYLVEKYIFSFVRERRNLKNSYSNIKEILKFSLPLFLSGFAGYFLKWTDTFMLGYFRTIQEVGIFNVAIVVGSFITLLPELLMPSAYPIIVKYFSGGDKEESKKLLRFVNKWIFIFGMPIAVLILLSLKNIIIILFGQKYVSAVICSIIILFGKLFWIISNIGIVALTMIRKTKFILYTNLFLLLINLILDLILIPRYGIIAAAFSTSFVLFLQFLIYAYFVKKYLYISIMPPCVLSIAAYAAICSIPFFLTYNIFADSTIFFVLGRSLIYLIMYVTFLWLSKIFKHEDIYMMRTVVDTVFARIK